MTWLEEQEALKKERLFESFRKNQKDTCDNLAELKESLEISLEEAITLYRENIGNVSEDDIIDAKFELLADVLPVAGYIDEDGCTVAPASWRD